MNRQTSEAGKLLAKLARCTSDLRRYIWLRENRGQVLWLDGKCTVTTDEPFRYGSGKDLDAALGEIEEREAHKAREERQRQRFAECFGSEVTP
jgi:hypothetical protein